MTRVYKVQPFPKGERHATRVQRRGQAGGGQPWGLPLQQETAAQRRKKQKSKASQRQKNCALRDQGRTDTEESAG